MLLSVNRVNAINVGWTLTDNEHMLQRIEMNNDNWIEEADKVRRVILFSPLSTIEAFGVAPLYECLSPPARSELSSVGGDLLFGVGIICVGAYRRECCA